MTMRPRPAEAGAVHRPCVVDTTRRRRYPPLIAGVMKWQTCQTQNLVGGNARVGSSPTAGKAEMHIR